MQPLFAWQDCTFCSIGASRQRPEFFVAPAIKQRTKTVGRSPTVLVRRQWKRFLPLGARTEEAVLRP
jgi:hypothetical protein